MPVQVSYPGVYVEEMPTAVHTIVGLSDSEAAFVDVFKRGELNTPTRINSMADFERTFGGVWWASESSYGISQFFLNGGQTAWVVRVAPVPPVASEDDGEDADAKKADAKTSGPFSTTAKATIGSLDLEASSPGSWANDLEVAAINTSADGDDAQKFSLLIRNTTQRNGRPAVSGSEVFHDLTFDTVTKVLERESDLVRVDGEATPDGRTKNDAIKSEHSSDVQRHHVAAKINSFKSDEHMSWQSFKPGSDGFEDGDSAAVLTALEALLPGDPAALTGIYALPTMAPNRFNMLCLPSIALMGEDDAANTLRTEAKELCRAQRAVFLVDCPVRRDGAHQMTAADMEKWYDTAKLGELAEDAAVYYPPVAIAEPGQFGQQRIVGASGTIAGLIARTDTERGVWKAPAGTEATLLGAAPTVHVTDADNGPLNELGVNVLRTFPIYGDISWGARTTAGADVVGSQWKYLPVRRTALHIENSLHDGLKWVVFEPNDEPTWAKIRLDVGTFMHDLFRQGAFEGATPAEAYFVKCDHTTTPQLDIDKGIVNIGVGFAPLKPAEFVILQISQIANG